MSRITSFFKQRTQTLNLYVRAHPRISGGVLIVLGLLIAFSGSLSGKKDQTTGEQTARKQVHLASILSLSQAQSDVSLVGEVRARSQAELRTLSPGEVTRVYVKAGDIVSAGALLVEFENSSERASVLQAEGAYLSARAQYAKALAGARSEDTQTVQSSAESAQSSLASAYTNARSAYAQALSLAQDAIFARTDIFFKNPFTTMPTNTIRNATLYDGSKIETERVALGSLLDTWKRKTNSQISDSELEQALAEAQSTLARIQTFANSVGVLVAQQKTDAELTDSIKASEQASALSARSSADSARALLIGAQQGITNAKNGNTSAHLAEEKIIAGERPEDIASAQAGVVQAEGALASARAQLEKKRIRAPIAGTVATLSVGQGDFVPAYTTVAVVANPQALEIETFVSEAMIPRMVVGGLVSIGENATGTITSVAPGLDPSTKKARVTIGLPPHTSLVQGSFVTIALLGETSTSTTPEKGVGFAIPITAIKVLPSGLALLTVNASSTLEAHPIPEGTIVGDRMIVKEGVTGDLVIVADTRGLAEGEEVEIARE